ncbi:MAG: rhomboid family intramembrane serine protease [Myxococcales bacterium]|nr:rhomboid family intramembrane serine protease [Myxococcales bacterium]
MYYELALTSVIVAGAYWGWFFVTKQPHGTATFGLMQFAAAALSGLGLYAHRAEEPAAWMGIAGAIGVGAGACLLVIGPLVRGLGRRFAATERLGIARRLLDIAEVLAPGSGVADEKALIGAMQEIRDGHIEQTVDALTAAKDRAPAEARLAIDERIAMLYLAAYRWNDAIAHAEANLFGAVSDLPPEPASPVTEAAEVREASESGQPKEAAPRPQPLRRVLGVAPPVWVELLGAYGRTGDLDRAAQMLARLEDACEGREEAGVWIHRARLMFLALAGRTAAVQTLVQPRQARHMSPAARTYWLAVAHEQKGDRAAATAAYQKARGRSRGRPRDLIEQALANLAKADGVPVTLSDEAHAVVARVEAAPLPAQVRAPAVPHFYATWSLTTAMLAVAAAITLSVGATNDVGVLMRSGAMVRGLVDGGEWWRIFSCVFVHVGGLHLLVNVIVMAFVGRIAEEMFGTARTFALFAVAGFAGAVASYLASPGGISAGASGALFGLLGAVFVELSWHRQRYRAAWKRGMWGRLALVIGAQLGYGFFYPVIDQWAHGAGLIAGAVFAVLLSPHARWAKAGLQLGRGIAVVSLAFLLLAGVRVARTSIYDSFWRLPRYAQVVGGVSITAPAAWINDGELSEPDGLVVVTTKRVPLTNLASQLAAWIGTDAPAIAKARYGSVVAATDPTMTLPKKWEGAELTSSFEDPVGYVQRYRLVVCGRVFGDELILIMVSAPETIARKASPFLAFLVASIRAS